MAELSHRERLQPSLLDRLTDEDPTKKKESREARVLSMRELRAAVLRDLQWLFNTGHLESVEDLDPYPEIKKTVLNYGLPDMGRYTNLAQEASAIERVLAEAIRNFEPRIIPDTLRVDVLPPEKRRDPNTLAFEIHGELWAQPLPLRLFLQTELDIQGTTADIADYDRLGSGSR